MDNYIKNKNQAVGEAGVIPTNLTTLRDKIYTIRGQQVMLDFDLAEIYGYTTKAFNQQVKNNIEKFEGEDFMFRLTKEETNLKSQFVITSESHPLNLRSQFVTSNDNRSLNLKSKNLTSSWGGSRSLPYAFTEQGIYMLMTVLRGNLAVQQSRALIRAFKAMKDYIITAQTAISYKESLRIMMQITDNSKDIADMKTKIKKIGSEVKHLKDRVDTTVKYSEISPVLLDFGKFAETREFLFLDGEPARATETFMDIYNQATETIYIIDNYINIKTLRQMQDAKENLKITIFSDNIGSRLSQADYNDFIIERPDLKISFITTDNLIHDRFIILDYGLKTEKIYQCGASTKDAGNKVTMIHEITSPLTKQSMKVVINRLFQNPKLELK